MIYILTGIQLLSHGLFKQLSSAGDQTENWSKHTHLLLASGHHSARTKLESTFPPVST